MPSKKPTNQEIICTFMEPKPAQSPGWIEEHRWPKPQWWVPHEEFGGEWRARELTLDTLWEVEERLANKQWQKYEDELTGDTIFVSARALLHATPEQKIKALAAVLR